MKTALNISSVWTFRMKETAFSMAFMDKNSLPPQSEGIDSDHLIVWALEPISLLRVTCVNEFARLYGRADASWRLCVNAYVPV